HADELCTRDEKACRGHRQRGRTDVPLHRVEATRDRGRIATEHQRRTTRDATMQRALSSNAGRMEDRETLLRRRAEARVGTVIRGKWRIDSVLGSGGMASVFAATHRNGMRGALKLMHPELALDAGAMTRFLREGYVANRVGHPGAVRIIDDDVAEDGS